MVSRSKRLLVTSMVACFGYGLWATAAEAANVQINATVVAQCTVAALNPLNFGNYSSGQANAKTAQVDVTHNCPANLNITLTLSGGSSNDPNSRLMNGPSGAVLQCNLFKEAAFTNIWSSGANGVIVNPTVSGTQVRTIFGRITGGQGVAVGAYTDTVVYDLTVNG